MISLLQPRLLKASHSPAVKSVDNKIVIISSTGRVIKTEEPKPEDPLVPNRVPPQEADAFRGVHLDPNAHHWDEVRYHLSWYSHLTIRIDHP